MRRENSRAHAAPIGATERLGRVLYRYRGYTPLPLVALVVLRGEPTSLSASPGLLLVLLGESIRIWALRYIGGASRSKRLGAASLVTGGPYARTRNPLYLGNLFLSSGLAVFSGIPYLVPLLVGLFAVQYVPIIRSEERELGRLFPEAYEAYAKRVPRFLPRLRPGSGGGERTGIGEALRVERRTLAAVALLVLAMLARGRLAGGPA